IDEQKSILDGGVLSWPHVWAVRQAETLKNASKHYGFPFDPSLPIRDLGPVQRTLLLYGAHSSQFRQYFPAIEPPTTVANGNFEGIITNIMRRYAERIDDPDYRAEIEKLLKI